MSEVPLYMAPEVMEEGSDTSASLPETRNPKPWRDFIHPTPSPTGWEHLLV